MAALTPADVLAIPHLGALPAEEAARLARELVVRTWSAREVVIREGEPCTGFLVLRSGRARIFRAGPDGREQILRLLGPGETFNEVPLFDRGTNPSSVETLEASETVLVPAAVVHDLMARYPAVAELLLEHFARRLRSFTEFIEQLSLQTVQQRIARYLYFSAREEGVTTPEGVVVRRTITQQDLASLVGSVREVVSRTLKVMEDEGVVEVRRKEFVVRDLRTLRELL